MFTSRTWLRLFLVVTLLAAFALRVFHLSVQSLWYDEAFSVWLGRMDVGAITSRTAADIQPPLYYYLLHFWIGAAGWSEFSVRFLSLFFGVLTVPLIYVAARQLFGRAAAVCSALLALVSPLYLWYSQEARMYTLITFLGLLSSYALLRALDGGANGKRWWIAFVAANLAAVYTHYFAFAVIAFQLVYALFRLTRSRFTSSQPAAYSRPSSSVLRPFLSFAAIGVAFLPWVPFMLNRLGEDASYWRGALKLDEAVRHLFINFTTGESMLEDPARLVAAGWLLVLLVGLVAFVLRERRSAESHSDGLAFAALYLLVPLVLLLFLFYRNPKFNARYLMVASPGFILLVSAGLGAMWEATRGLSGTTLRLPRAVPLAALLLSAVLAFGSSAYADGNAFFDAAFTKPDMRGVADYVAAHAGANEAVVLSSGHMFPAFDYYFSRADLPELRLPDDPTLNTEHVLGYSTAGELNRGLTGKRGVWLVQWQDEVVDPNGFLPLLLSSRGTGQPVESSFWHVKLAHWSLPPEAHFSDQPEMSVQRDANFKNKIELLGLDAPAVCTADQGACFNLYWQALDAMSEDYQVAVRVVDAQGNVWGTQERRPAGYTYPTTRWKKDEKLFGSFSVPLLPGTPPGEYYVLVSLFTNADTGGLDVLAPNGSPIGRSVRIGPFKVLPASKPPEVRDLQMQHTLNLPAGPFTLLGYDLPRTSASPGESIPVTLYWRADQAPSTEYRFQLALGDKATLPLANDTYPTQQWRAGEIVRGQFPVQVPAHAEPGTRNLRLVVTGNTRIDLDLGEPFTVQKTDRVFVPPPADHKQDANFNNAIQLASYSLSGTRLRAGDTLTVTLNWKALAAMDRPYTVFVHLLDKDNKVPVQKDSQPQGGARPTQTWIAGEYVTDTYSLLLQPSLAGYPSPLPPGEYRLEVGWYDAADPGFARLQVLDANGSPSGDSVILDDHITVEGNQ